MKKKFNQKLALNKNTVANLENREMGNLRGGTEYTNETCDYYCLTESCNTGCRYPESLCLCHTGRPTC